MYTVAVIAESDSFIIHNPPPHTHTHIHTHACTHLVCNVLTADLLQEAPWSSISEDDLFSCEAQSMASVHSADRSADSIVQRRSRVSSQENGQFL